MAFSTKECAWAQTSLKLLGSTIIGIRGFEFKKSFEKELIFAAGDEAIDITSGNKSVSGSITMLKFEIDKLNEAAQAALYEDITEVPHPLILITCSFKLTPTSPIQIIETPLGVAFTDITIAMQQNAKMTEVPLPFIAQKMTMRRSG
jgi:hypothetical protein